MGLNEIVENIIHSLRYRTVRKYLTSCETLVDLGCGATFRFLKRHGGIAKQCWGLDVTVADKQIGHIRLRHHNITKRLPFKDNSVDLMTCLAVMEHIEDPIPILGECYRVLSPDGRLIVTTPSQAGMMVHEALRRMRLVQDVEKDEHKDFAMSAEKLANWATKAGFQVQEAKTFEIGLNILMVAQKQNLCMTNA